MRPKRFTVTSANSPVVIPLNYRGGPTSVVSTPNGSGNYDVAFTTVDIQDSTITPNWVDGTDMSAATTQQSNQFLNVTALRITLNSGTNVEIDLSSGDV